MSRWKASGQWTSGPVGIGLDATLDTGFTGPDLELEALNAANHPYFPNPSMTVTTAQTIKDTGFGQISASTMNNYARRLQMALRFVF